MTNIYNITVNVFVPAVNVQFAQPPAPPRVGPPDPTVLAAAVQKAYEQWRRQAELAAADERLHPSVTYPKADWAPVIRPLIPDDGQPATQWNQQSTVQRCRVVDS